MISIAQHFAESRCKAFAFLTFKQIDNVLRLVLVEQNPRQPESRHLLELVRCRTVKHCAESIRSILIAVLVHVKTRHRKLGLRRVARIGICRAQLVSSDLCLLQLAVNDVIGQRFVQCRRLHLCVELAVLIVVHAEQQQRTCSDAKDDVTAVLRPPASYLIDLFFF